MRVLIVEDELLIAEEMATICEELGHEVVAVVRGQAGALSAAAAHSPDVAVMDLRLADGDCGVRVARLLQERFGLRSIYASGTLAAKLEAIRAFDPEPLALLDKPVGKRQLAAAERALAEEDSEPAMPLEAVAKPEDR